MARTDKRIYLLFTVTILYWFALYTYVPYLTPYAASIGASHSMMGLILGSYGLIQLFLRIPMGLLSDYTRSRKIFIISGLLLALISSAGMYYFPYPLLLLLFRTMSGIAAAMWVLYTILYCSYYSKEKTPEAVGFINASGYIGQISAILLAGLVTQYYGLQSAFLLSIIGAAAGGILSLSIVENKDALTTPLKLPELLEVARDHNLLGVSVLAIIVQLMTYATMYGFTPLFAKHIGASNAEIAVLTALPLLPGVFIAPLSGTFFARQMGERPAVLFGTLLMALTCIAIPYTAGINLLYLLQFIQGTGRSLAFPLLMGLSIKSIDNAKRATAMGIFQSIYTIGMFMGPVIIGALSDEFGLKFGFIAMGIFGLAGAVLTGMLINRRTTAESY